MTDMTEHIRQSNLIENIDDKRQDKRSLKAWEWLEKQEVISIPVLLELHAKITSTQLPAHEAGQFRKVDVWIGGHIAPPPAEAKRLAIKVLRDLDERWDKIVPEALHINFEKAHPFVDGNGRTGRMLMWWHQVKLGKEPMLISWANRRAYYDWFRG